MIIYGNGAAWWPNIDSPRPPLLSVENSNNIIISGITIQDSPKYNLVLLNSGSLTVHDIYIKDPQSSPNTDGIHIYQAVTNLEFYNCIVDNGDDFIAINSSGSNPVENLNFHDMTLISGHGASIGSAIYAYISNIIFENFTLNDCSYGLRIKAGSSNKTSCTVSNVTYDNITMTNIANQLEYDNGDKGNSQVKLHDISYTNVTSNTFGNYASFILDNVQFTEVQNTNPNDPNNKIQEVNDKSFTVSGGTVLVNINPN